MMLLGIHISIEQYFSTGTFSPEFDMIEAAFAGFFNMAFYDSIIIVLSFTVVPLV